MKHKVEQTNYGMRISVVAGSERQKALLEEFAKCAAGTCTCPTQYAKVECMEVATQESGVIVNLKIKPGQSIDVADIERCLDHTAQIIGG